MERVSKPSFAVLLSLLLAACGSERVATGVEDAGALAPEAAAAAASAEAACRGEPHESKLTVMTRNLYLGGAIETVAAAETPEEVVAAASQFWVDVQLTDFPSRAKVIADEVFWVRPDVLGLQEVTLYRSLPSVACAPPDAGAVEQVELDFLDELRSELRHRGLHYEVAAQVTTMDAQLCVVDVLAGGDTKYLRYTDREVLLVREDVRWRTPTLPSPDDPPIPAFVPAPPFVAGPGDLNGGVYAMAIATGDGTYLPTTAFFAVQGSPEPVYSWRGWTAVEVERGGQWVRIFETHVEDQLAQLEQLEPPDGPLPRWYFQAFQDAELLSILEASRAMAPLPTIALGDFNVYRQHGDKNPPTYSFLTGGPFPLPIELGIVSPLSDAWKTVHHGQLGLTWGFDPDLRSGKLETTLDLVLSTDDIHPIASYLVGTRDRTRSGLHPSDHAGIVTVFAIR